VVSNDRLVPLFPKADPTRWRPWAIQAKIPNAGPRQGPDRAVLAWRLQFHEIDKGLSDMDFNELFTQDKPLIFAFHAYPWLIHRLTDRRTNHDNIHVRGYKEESSITTPFDDSVAGLRNAQQDIQVALAPSPSRRVTRTPRYVLRPQ
jgi:hypothetical protein